MGTSTRFDEGAFLQIVSEERSDYARTVFSLNDPRLEGALTATHAALSYPTSIDYDVYARACESRVRELTYECDDSRQSQSLYACVCAEASEARYIDDVLIAVRTLIGIGESKPVSSRALARATEYVETLHLS
jgi:hypothetical protein